MGMFILREVSGFIHSSTFYGELCVILEVLIIAAQCNCNHKNGELYCSVQQQQC